MADSTISNLTAQTTLHDADLGVGVDTTDTSQSANGTTKKWTWTTIKAFLKTYFDGLYLGIGANAVSATTATTATNVTGGTITSETLSTGVKLDANADQNITYYGMARQAIMNGNFDVWQRGTSVALADVTQAFLADRWRDFADKNGGTLPTLTRSRQLQTSGDIANSFYFTRLATNGAGTSLGVSSFGFYGEAIENGTSKLCGLNKKVTVSFYAKSDIANKRITPTLIQSYGTGGSPTADEVIKGTPITLSATWTKYTATFTTNTLVGKTFGTTGDDYIDLRINYMWGTTYGNANIQTSVTAETFVGAGNIDIAQVQLCSGDVALPFQPKSFEEELRACQRYYEKNSSATNIFSGNVTSGQNYYLQVMYKVNKRTGLSNPVLTNSSNVNFAASVGTPASGDSGFYEIRAANGTGAGLFCSTWTVSDEL